MAPYSATIQLKQSCCVKEEPEAYAIKEEPAVKEEPEVFFDAPEAPAVDPDAGCGSFSRLRNPLRADDCSEGSESCGSRRGWCLDEEGDIDEGEDEAPAVAYEVSIAEDEDELMGLFHCEKA